MEDGTQNEKPRSNKSKKKSEGKEASALGKSPASHSRKRGVQRSRSGGVLSKSRNARSGTRNINRSKSEDDGKSEELVIMSKATESPDESPSVASSKKSQRTPKTSRKVKKSAASNNSKSPSRINSMSPLRKGTSPTRKAAEPQNSISPKQRRADRSKSPNEHGRGRPPAPANRRSSLTKLYSWWDLSANKKSPKRGEGSRSPSPPPAPPPLPASVRSARANRKRSDSDVTGLLMNTSPLSRSVKSAVVTRRKKGRSKSHEDEHDILEISKSSLLAQDSISSSFSRSNMSARRKGRKKSHDSMDDSSLLHGDNESKTSSKKIKKNKKKKPTSNSNYATLLDSPSTSSLASTISGVHDVELEDTLKPPPSLGDLYDNFVGELFDISKMDQSKRSTMSEDYSHDHSDSDDDTASLANQEVKWIEVAMDNPADVVIKAIHDDQQGANDAIQTFVVPAGTRMMNTLADDFARTPFKSIIEGGNSKNNKKSKTKKKKKPNAKTPSLGETIGGDPRSIQNRPPDDRANCTLGTAESEQTQKATNHHQHHHQDPRISDTVHEIGYLDLKTDDDDNDDGNDKLGTSSHSVSSRSSIQSNKSSKSLPSRHVRKKSKDGNTNLSSSSHEPRRALRRSASSRRQLRAGSRDAPRRRSGSRAALRRSSSHHARRKSSTNNNISSEIDEFMAMTKDDLTASPNKESTDGTLSTTTESTMATADTRRSRRSSAGPAHINQTLIDNFQLTF